MDVKVNSTTKIVLESSEVSSISDSVSYLEKCECPTGYDGLSCQVSLAILEFQILIVIFDRLSEMCIWVRESAT